MTPEYLQVIFDAFTRAENSTTNKVQGTGLGTAITKSIVELMGCTIDVQSQDDQGTLFRVELQFRIPQGYSHQLWQKAGITDVLVVGALDARELSSGMAWLARLLFVSAFQEKILRGTPQGEAIVGDATDFEMQVIGFPSSRGQMPVMPMTVFAIGAEAAHKEEAMAVLDVLASDEALQVYSETNRVISPSKSVEVECVEALRPLNERIYQDVYVLGSNASMKVEQWGNICLIVRNLLGGATVEECMAKFDQLQEDSLKP